MQSEHVDPLGNILSSLPDADVSGARDRVRARIESTLSHRNGNYVWWKRAVSIPLPAAVAAALVVVFLAVYTSIGFQPSVPQTAHVETPAAESLDINVHVDASHTTDLIDWLNEQDVGNVTIQLPDTATFDLLGEPVLVRPEELMIEPLDPVEPTEELPE